MGAGEVAGETSGVLGHGVEIRHKELRAFFSFLASGKAEVDGLVEEDIISVTGCSKTIFYLERCGGVEGFFTVPAAFFLALTFFSSFAGGASAPISALLSLLSSFVSNACACTGG